MKKGILISAPFMIRQGIAQDIMNQSEGRIVTIFSDIQPNSTSDFFTKKCPIDQPGIPLIAIPTTSGTASEITTVSVLTDTINDVKTPLASDYFYPVYAIIDPDLTLTYPPHVTAASGLDVLVHSLEEYYGKKHQPFTLWQPNGQNTLVFDYLLNAYHEPDNIEARAKMSEASVTAGAAFHLTQTAAAHD